MAEIPDVRRRGRREGALNAALPAHRLAFAIRLRDLRRECGQPPYRTLGRLGHCGSGSLSEAASGRRFPTWEMTRGYVTGCLKHAGREADIDRLLPAWRRAWEDADVRERAHVAGSSPRPDRAVTASVTLRPVRRPPVGRMAAAILAVLFLMATMVAADAMPSPPKPMAGLYNVLVAPFDSFVASAPPGPAAALQHTLARDLTRWAADETAVEARGPAGVERIGTGDPARRESALNRLAAKHNADIVVTGLLHAAGDRWTVVVEVLLTARVFGETPEFVGRHELSLTEPADMVRGNVELNRRLADDAVLYVKTVTTFVRGLGRYALEDYPGAERDFRVASHELAASQRTTTRSEVILLMLGNALGRGGEPRYAEAAATFRLALAQRPGYARATVGLAEALRSQAGCDPGNSGGPPLRQAIGHYRTALSARVGTLLEMKARLGLGLSYQCLSVTAAAGHWAQADTEFTQVLRVHAAGRLTEEAGRQSLRLAAEAHAGRALSAYLTASGSPTARSARLAAAARAYEQALDLLGRIGVTRPAIRNRELLFLRNLRDVYRAMGAAAGSAAVDDRIRRAGGSP